MATYYRFKRPIANSGAMSYETMTTEAWCALDNKEAVLAFEDSDGNIYDYSEYISELQIQHNDIDSEGAGRDKKSGKMVRKFVTNKHTINVKTVNHLPQDVAHSIANKIRTTHEKTHFYVWIQRPCAGIVNKCDVYCSTINYGAQRYDRYTNKCYYDGMNFNLIEM